MSGGNGLDRRGFLARGLAAASTTLLGGCDLHVGAALGPAHSQFGRSADPGHAARVAVAAVGPGARIARPT